MVDGVFELADCRNCNYMGIRGRAQLFKLKIVIIISATHMYVYYTCIKFTLRKVLLVQSAVLHADGIDRDCTRCAH